MKKSILFLLINVFCFSTIAQKIKPDDVVGEWLAESKEGKVLIYKRDNKYFGKVSWGKNPSKDTKNPNAALRNNSVIGLEILKNFVFNGTYWEEGTIYDPKNGKTYSCTMKMQNINTLDLRGFIGVSLLGRTTVWTRVK
ncbi:MAG: DUF2147 domain-containing protein [Pseudarcicella sp.]|nr:DUF2147 domain-containing protein [Pseudarcicella sp.]MBP6411269.1 DUF2147 domain-containing protein [Pseudarcicella sp.]